MSSPMHNHFLKQSSFEDLPDEILLSVCRYLSPINILDSLLNLNKRLNQTISSYREKIFLSHLSYKDFNHLLNDHLPCLAMNVYYLYINNCSMLNIGKMFEAKFNKIDQQFPLLRELSFHQIDIETLENLSWRFNTMHCLRQLNIDIAEDRLSSMPVQFDEFLCGKLFSVSNSFESLKLNFNKYQFNLHSIKHKCLNLRYLTISVKCLNDLLILFDNFPNIEQLNVTIGCSSLYDKTNDTYAYEQLWWKVPYLSKFDLTIRQKELTSHDNIIPNNIIIKITENIFQLVHFKFIFDISFGSLLQLITTKDVYIEKYFPYANGLLWEQALKRNDNRSIRFDLHIELDGPATDRLKRKMEPNMYFIDKSDSKINSFHIQTLQFLRLHLAFSLFQHTKTKMSILELTGEYKNSRRYIDFNSLLKTTFSNAYWLQKNIAIQYFSTASKHVSIYTLPIRSSHLSTTVDIIDQEISMKSSPSHLNIQNLIIRSNIDYDSSKLSITNLFTKFPYLTDLKIDTELLLPPTIIICSNHLRSLSLCNYSVSSCCKLLNYLPKLISLSITNSYYCSILDFDSYLKPMLSITRLKISIYSVDVNNLIDITQYFPNVNEFHLIIKNASNGSSDDSGQYKKCEQFLQRFMRLRYIEIMLPVKQESFSISNWIYMLDSNQMISTETAEHRSMILKTWL